MVTLRIISLATGGDSPFDGQYVRRYDPSYHPKGEVYDGGLLLVTPNKEEARQFEGAAEAMEYWRQSYGVREDGQLNRPLVAFTVEVS